MTAQTGESAGGRPPIVLALSLLVVGLVLGAALGLVAGVNSSGSEMKRRVEEMQAERDDLTMQLGDLRRERDELLEKQKSVDRKRLEDARKPDLVGSFSLLEQERDRLQQRVSDLEAVVKQQDDELNNLRYRAGSSSAPLSEPPPISPPPVFPTNP